MELLNYVHQKSSCKVAAREAAGPSGYELQITRNGQTETWKGKVRYYGVLEMQGGTHFHQLRFFSHQHPLMYLNFVLPDHKILAEGSYTFRPVPYEESGSLNESVTEFLLPEEDGFPEPARRGYTHIQLGRNGFAITGYLNAKMLGRQNKGCQLKGRFWLDHWGRIPINQLNTKNFT